MLKFLLFAHFNIKHLYNISSNLCCPFYISKSLIKQIYYTISSYSAHCFYPKFGPRSH